MKRKTAKTIIVTTVIALIVLPIILYLILWSKISSNRPMNRALEEKVNYLESRVEELEKLEELGEKISEIDSSDETVNDSSEGTDTKKPEEKTLQELISSENPEDWLEAASCVGANEEQLLEIAIKATRISCYATHSEDKNMQLKIANALLANPTTTEDVLKEFRNSRFEEVQVIGRRTSVNAMIESEKPEDWLEAAKSNEITEEQLIIIAEKAADLCYYSTNTLDQNMQIEIEEEIMRSPNATRRVMEEFKNSRFPDVVEFAEQWLEKN